MKPVETSPSPAPQPGAPLRRADARRNQERVFAAALEVFQESGLQGTVPQIAKRAEVGKATVYRSYPTKEDLVGAAVNHRLAELRRSTAPALAQADPYRAFSDYVLRLFESLAGDRLLSEVLADAGFRSISGLLTQLSDLMESAKPTGQIRADASILDLRVVLCGMAVQLIRIAERDPELWRRYGELTLRALRP
ncbi:TetR/AcrR family transcriptional regulator [Streptomyces sp. NPDC058382]|uniref:TetR/AcrR family transcriptional regulator n=1 Tax=unclassified Streptomyces TaxID=2593676 RepID=UPI003628C6A6